MHLNDVAFFAEVDHPIAGPLRLPTFPDPTDKDEAARFAPTLGQHTEEVLAALALARTPERN